MTGVLGEKLFEKLFEQILKMCFQSFRSKVWWNIQKRFFVLFKNSTFANVYFHDKFWDTFLLRWKARPFG